VGSLRRQWNIPRFKSPPVIPEGELLTIKQAAAVLGIATSTVHRWLNDGFIGGEQLTPAAPWRIRLTEDLRARFVDEEPQGSLTMYQAMRLLGVSRQTVLQRVKRGELGVIHVKRGKKKGLRIKAIPAQPTLFDLTS
jgi:excisionase family DNA binding protein